MSSSVTLYAKNEPVEHGVRIHFEFYCYGYIDAVEFSMEGITLCGCKAEPTSYLLNVTYVLFKSLIKKQISFLFLISFSTDIFFSTSKNLTIKQSLVKI